MNLNEAKLSQVIETAKARVADHRRWTNAINKAAVMIESNPYLHWTGHSLLMLSESGEIYEANGVCQCAAFGNGQPCKHRAAYQLIKRYNETVH